MLAGLTIRPTSPAQLARTPPQPSRRVPTLRSVSWAMADAFLLAASRS
jgi:hypothetical protein